jgi:translation initiation factor 1 (eIF-1/SUI1)
MPNVSLTDVRILQRAKGKTLCHVEGISVISFDMIYLKVALDRSTSPAARGL